MLNPEMNMFKVIRMAKRRADATPAQFRGELGDRRGSTPDKVVLSLSPSRERTRRSTAWWSSTSGADAPAIRAVCEEQVIA